MYYSNQKKEIPCPLCASKKSILLWSVNSSDAAQHFILKEKDEKAFFLLVSQIENLWSTNQCDVIKCLKCTFIFSNPYVSGNAEFYNLAYPKPGYPSWKWEFEFSYQLLKKSKIKDPNVLEIGAGQGSFIEKISERLIKKENIVCTEFSKYGREKISKLGVKYFGDDIRDIKAEKFAKYFDYIFMFQVLEHMDDLDRLFKTLLSMIKKDGSLVIAVPNDKWIEFNELNGAQLDMPPNHIGRWTKSSFKYLAEKNDFFMKKHRFEPFNFQKIIIQFGFMRYLKNAQNNKSFENAIEKKHSKRYYRAIKYIGIFINVIKSLPLVLKNYNAIYGDSQIVHLVKR